MRTGRVFAVLLLAATGLAGSSCTTGADGNDETLEELGAQYCTHVGESECGTPELEQQCLDELERNLADASHEGCERELDEYLRCAANDAIECTTIDTNPPMTYPMLESSTCVELVVEFHECVTWVAPNCAISNGADASGL